MLISIITPCLNSARTIRQTIESVLNQTYKNIEYIIVDGGSTDGTLEIIREYEPLFGGRMEYASGKDGGIYDAMNKGILCAAGDAVGIINSDDWYEKGALEKAAEALKDGGADAVYGEIWLIGRDGERECHTWHSAFPPHPATFIRREIYRRHGVFDLNYRIASDRELLLRLMAEGVRFKRIDAVLANFRRTGISNAQILMCAEETYGIDLKYLAKCPEHLRRDEVEEKYEREMLLHISQCRPQIIRKIFGGENCGADGVAVFGAGNCGRELLAILKRCGVPAHLIVDNDTGKWGLEYRGVRIYPPEILRGFSGHAVVTAGRFKDDICKQLQDYGNPALSWSILGDMRKKAIRIYGEDAGNEGILLGDGKGLQEGAAELHLR